MDRKNAGAERSKKCLADALFSLMEEKPFAAISVTDIAKQADYTRQTFYQHFDSKEEIVTYFFEDLFDTIFEAGKQVSVSSSEELLQYICHIMMTVYWSEKSRYTKVLLDNNLTLLLVDNLVKAWKLVCDNYDFDYPFRQYTEEEQEYIYRYVSGGPLIMISHWIANGKAMDQEAFEHLLFEMLKPVFVG